MYMYICMYLDKIKVAYANLIRINIYKYLYENAMLRAAGKHTNTDYIRIVYVYIRGNQAQ